MDLSIPYPYGEENGFGTSCLLFQCTHLPKGENFSNQSLKSSILSSTSMNIDHTLWEVKWGVPLCRANVAFQEHGKLAKGLTPETLRPTHTQKKKLVRSGILTSAAA